MPLFHLLISFHFSASLDDSLCKEWTRVGSTLIDDVLEMRKLWIFQDLSWKFAVQDQPMTDYSFKIPLYLETVADLDDLFYISSVVPRCHEFQVNTFYC